MSGIVEVVVAVNDVDHFADIAGSLHIAVRIGHVAGVVGELDDPTLLIINGLHTAVLGAGVGLIAGGTDSTAGNTGELTCFVINIGGDDFVVKTVVILLHGLEQVALFIIGVGIGGDFEQCALLSKKALCRDTDIRNSDKYYAQMEKELLEKINKLEIGPQGFGGSTTALAVNIETAPTHIAGLPVAVNIGCYVTRHATTEVK